MFKNAYDYTTTLCLNVNERCTTWNQSSHGFAKICDGSLRFSTTYSTVISQWHQEYGTVY